MDLDLLVIGSGPSGQKAAIQAAKLGRRVAVVERRQRLGGVSIHTGTIPSKTLRVAVLEDDQHDTSYSIGVEAIEARLGALPETFMGLSGLCDLVLTATGDLSRNRRVGLLLGQSWRCGH